MTETSPVPAPEPERIPLRNSAAESRPATSVARGRWRASIPWSYLTGLTAICLVAVGLLAIVMRGTPGAPAVAPTSPTAPSTALNSVATCAGDIDFDSPVNGAGWSAPEVTPDGGTFVWTTSTNSTITLDQPIAPPFELEAQIHMAMAPDILESVRFSVNGQPLPTEIMTDASGATTIRARVAQDTSGAALQMTEIGISINRTQVPGSASDRTLGVAFDQMRFFCLEDVPAAAASGPPSSGEISAVTPAPANRRGATPESPAQTATARTGAVAVAGTSTTSMNCPPRRSADPSAAGRPCLSANPNPVPMVGERGVVTIGWSIGDAPRESTGHVFVAKDGRPEELFVMGRRGSAQARIRGGAVYEFRLYSGPDREQLMASVIVWTS